MLLKACLNGARAATGHPRLPITPEALAEDAAACHAAGAGAFHVHPRAAHGGESLDAADIGAAVTSARPLLVHGSEGGAWAVLDHAARHGFDTRIGLEDTLTLRDGRRAEDNAALVAEAVQAPRGP
ncbi:3-keto-5-aminohexanoate cleavage protein [Corallococcus sp. AS-1-12]|uniref:3-keto-5-aminohexanoate cleavage protein n=1 Tax=Corallococcus sp. AS-1-12 TaxID=2874598 RepID=UPI001CBE79B1|nr:3-keto-5-aminohexanoate cleavage protein [Corallococcus sp. AS-1-12]MBZ4335839.1 3-keto-5-aminohexanoate cleavage protein [Corallococcus sp. AS-1-12]